MRAAAEISDKLFDTRASSETGNEALDKQKTGSTIAPYPKNQLQKEVPDQGVQNWNLPP